MDRPHLAAIFIAPAAGQPMISVPQVEAIAGRGLVGDRYAEGTGYYSRHGDRMACEVTLIAAEALARMTTHHGAQVEAGQHRRNLVTQNLDLTTLQSRRFRIGPVLFEYLKPRPPCAYLGRLTDRLLPRALGEGPGLCASVVAGGLLKVGDLIHIETNYTVRPPRYLP